MTTIATRPRVAKVKPAPVTSPLADILERIGTSQRALVAALSATDEGSDLWTMLFGIDDNLMPYSLESLYRTPVNKEDVGEAYEKLLFTLTVLKAALMMSKGLVMEAKLQEAFEILDRAHNDMDSALVQDWPIPDGTDQPDDPAATVHAVEQDPARIAITCKAGRDEAEVLYDFLDQAKTLAFLVSFHFSGDGVDEAPGTALMIEGIEAALERGVEFMGAMTRPPSTRAMAEIRHAHALAAHLTALSQQDLAANAPDGIKLPAQIGFNFGNGQVQLCYWTLEKMIDRAEDALSDCSGRSEASA